MGSRLARRRVAIAAIAAVVLAWGSVAIAAVPEVENPSSSPALTPPPWVQWLVEIWQGLGPDDGDECEPPTVTLSTDGYEQIEEVGGEDGGEMAPSWDPNG